MQRLLGINDPEDDSPDEDVSPLTQLYGADTPVAAGQRMAKPPASATGSGGTPLNETLARILLSIGSIGGTAPPKFLTDQLRDSAIMRRQQQVQEAIQTRQEAAAETKAKGVQTTSTFITEGMRHEVNGDRKSAFLSYAKGAQSARSEGEAKQALSFVNGVKNSIQQGRAGGDLSELLTHLGSNEISREVFTTKVLPLIEQSIKDPGLRKEAAERLGQQLQSTSEGGNMIWRLGNKGPVLAVVPIPQVQVAGKNILSTRTDLQGNQEVRVLAGPQAVAGTSYQPTLTLPEEGTKLTPEQRAALSTNPALAGVNTFEQLATVPGGGRALLEASGPKPTAEQAPYLTKRGVSTNRSWEQIRLQFPNAPDVLLQDQMQEKVRLQVTEATAKNDAMANLPFVQAFPTSGKVTFNKTTRMRDPMISSKDIVAGKGVALDVTTARDVSQLQSSIAALNRLEGAAKKVLQAAPGMNLANALKLAVQRGLASSEDLAEFDSISGPLAIQIAAIINKGRPSEPDANAIRMSLVSSRDTVGTGTRKLASMKKLMMDSVDGYLGNDTKPLLNKDLEGSAVIPGIPLGGGTVSNDASWSRNRVR